MLETEVFVVTIRSLVSFITLLFLMRFIRKKQLSQYTFYDYVVGITIGSIAATLSVELENRTFSVVWGLIVWATLPVLLGGLYLKSMKIRKVLDGEATVIIEGGKILEDNLKKEMLNLEDLQMQLRSAGIFDFSEVEYAVLEKNGQVNALKKPEKQPVTLADLGIMASNNRVPLVLIMDGVIMKRTLASSSYTEEWLLKELDKSGVKDIKQVMLAQVDTAGTLYIDLKQDEINN